MKTSNDNASFLDQYNKAVTALENGLFHLAAEQANIWRGYNEYPQKNSDSLENLRRLLSARLALKGGVAIGSVEQTLDLLPTNDPFMLAEGHFVRGLFYFSSEQWTLGSSEFHFATDYYLKSEKNEKALLSKYNCYVGKVNAKTIDNLDQYEILTELEKQSLKNKSERILALVLRQKSYLLQTEGRFAGALATILEAAQLFRANGPQSDHHLAILQAADCFLDLGNSFEAQKQVDQLTKNVDARVEFARDYVLERLGLIKINIERYSIRLPFWENKWKKKQKDNSELETATWNIKTGELKLKDKLVIIKHNSKEGSLLSIIIKTKRTKATLCEMLWPEYSDRFVLDNRLHKLLSRLNKKIDLIGYKDGFYYCRISVFTY